MRPSFFFFLVVLIIPLAVHATVEWTIGPVLLLFLLVIDRYGPLWSVIVRYGPLRTGPDRRTVRVQYIKLVPYLL